MSSGYAEFVDVLVEAGRSTKLEVGVQVTTEVSGRPGTLNLSIVDAGGNPVGSLHTVFLIGRGGFFRVSIDEEGRAVRDDLPPGDYHMSVDPKLEQVIEGFGGDGHALPEPDGSRIVAEVAELVTDIRAPLPLTILVKGFGSTTGRKTARGRLDPRDEAVLQKRAKATREALDRALEHIRSEDPSLDRRHRAAQIQTMAVVGGQLPGEAEEVRARNRRVEFWLPKRLAR